MAKRVKVKVNKNLGGLPLDAHLLSILKGPAERVLAAAKTSAPVESGEYRDSLTMVGGASGDRMAYRVGSTAEHGPLVESRTGNLSRALDSA